MSEPRVALTFDAEHPSRPHCPPANQAAVVRELAAGGVTATFFLQGRWLTAYPDLGREIAAAGHLIGNHSHAHSRLTRLSREGLREDVLEAEVNIRAVTGCDPRPWFRCPFGDGADDAQVLAVLAESGYRHVGWDIDSEDWCDGRDPEEMRAQVVAGVAERGDGAIVLMHTWPAPTGAALGALIADLRRLGVRFVTVAELADA